MMWLLGLGVALAGTIHDATGAAVTAPQGARIVTLGGALTEVVYSMGLGGSIVGTDITSVYPVESTGKLPKVGYYRQLSAEGILSLQPGLILCTDQAGPPAVLDQLRGAGVVVAVLPSDPTLDAAKARIRDLGTLLDKSEQASQIVSKLESDISKVIPVKPAPRVLFVYVAANGTSQVSGSETAADAIIRLAGGVNAVDGWTGYRPVTAEGVIAARPDVILLTERGLKIMGGDTALWALPGMAATPAGQAHWRITGDDLLMLGFGPRTGEAASILAGALGKHP